MLFLAQLETSNWLCSMWSCQ